MPTTKIAARNLTSGDRTGSGETVVSVSAGLRTPRGKVEVTLEKDGRRRMSLWGAATLINVTRAPVDLKIATDGELYDEFNAGVFARQRGETISPEQTARLDAIEVELLSRPAEVEAPAPVAFTYNDLLHSDGTRNDAAYSAILARRIESEINAELCGVAGLSAPHGDGSPLGSVPAAHAALVKQHGLGPISQARRAKIEEFHRGEMDAWVASEQRRETKRFAMLAAEKRSEIEHAGVFQQAAE